jgi:hypothetical protein
MRAADRSIAALAQHHACQSSSRRPRHGSEFRRIVDNEDQVSRHCLPSDQHIISADRRATASAFALSYKLDYDNSGGGLNRSAARRRSPINSALPLGSKSEV